MKKFAIALILVAGLGISSCGNKSNSGSGNDQVTNKDTVDNTRTTTDTMTLKKDSSSTAPK